MLEVLADIVSFFISFLVSSLLLLPPMCTVLAGGCVLMMVIAIILLFCFHYYNVKLELGGIEMVARGFGALGCSFIIVTVAALLLGRPGFIRFCFLYYSYFFLCSLGTRFFFRFFLQLRNRARATSEYIQPSSNALFTIAMESMASTSQNHGLRQRHKAPRIPVRLLPHGAVLSRARLSSRWSLPLL